MLELLADNAPLRAFLAHEREAGLRLITALDGGVRPRLVTAAADLLRGEAADGAYRPPADPELLADAVVALGERWLHHGGVRDLNPDPKPDAGPSSYCCASRRRVESGRIG